MKRWIALGLIVMILTAGVFVLQGTAIDPGRFTGEWYGAEDGRLYRFHNGIIEYPADTQEEGAGFCGAYFFCSNRVILFTVTETGVSQVRELYPAGEPKGEFLSEGPEGNGRIVFSRSNLIP